MSIHLPKTDKEYEVGVARRADIVEAHNAFVAQHGRRPAMRELASQLGVSSYCIKYHFKILVDRGELQAPERQKSAYANGAAARKAIVEHFRDRDAASLPAPSLSDMAALLSYSPSNISNHMKVLVRDGVLVKDGRRYALSASHRRRVEAP